MDHEFSNRFFYWIKVGFENNWTIVRIIGDIVFICHVIRTRLTYEPQKGIRWI